MTPRKRLPRILIGIASLLAVLAIFALWANRQLLDTDNWTDTSTELLENDDVRGQTAIFLVDQLYENVDVEAQLEQALPPRVEPLAGPAAGALKDVAVRGADGLLQRPRVQGLWEDANERAHAGLINVVEGGGDSVSTEGGDVVLDLKSLLGQTADRVGVGGRVEERLPEDAAQITVLESDNLELAQDGVDILQASAWVLLILTFGLMGVAVAIAREWRREALRTCGIGLLFAGAGVLVVRSLAGDAVVDSLASTEAVRPAIEATWSISTSLMVEAATASIIYGAFLIVCAWLAGPTTSATAVRRGLAPYIREPGIAYGALAVIALGLVAWGPTPALRTPALAILLIGLLAFGVETLRRRTAAEFPAATREEAVAHLRERLAGMRAPRAAPTTATNGSGNGAADRLDQLERLGRLRDAGILEKTEFEREKAELLASGAPESRATP